jgi:hypothetical protein
MVVLLVPGETTITRIIPVSRIILKIFTIAGTLMTDLQMTG